jgi:superfamily II DNA helicase RecQ
MDTVYAVCASKCQIDSLRHFQKLCVQYLLDGKDVFISCRTGSGKSICFESYSTALAMFPRFGTGCVTIAVEPLIIYNATICE